MSWFISRWRLLCKSRGLFFLEKSLLFSGDIKLQAASYELVYSLNNKILHWGKFQTIPLKMSVFLTLKNQTCLPVRQARGSQLAARSFCKTTV